MISYSKNNKYIYLIIKYISIFINTKLLIINKKRGCPFETASFVFLDSWVNCLLISLYEPKSEVTYGHCNCATLLLY